MKNFEGGPSLVGLKVKQIVDGKYNFFVAIGEIIEYSPPKKKKRNGIYLIDFGKNKKYWRRRCDFEILKQQPIWI